MLWRPPIWAGSVASLWRTQAFLAVAVAGAEAGIGYWLRAIATLDSASAGRIRLWVAGLAVLLALRVVFSWRRDLVREQAALAAGAEFHRQLWSASLAPPVAAENSWLSREGREWIEGGTRAAAEMRTAVVTLVVLLPLLMWLAPWLALAVAACAGALGWVAQRRSRAGKAIAEQEASDARGCAESEDWSWRAMPEAAGSEIGKRISERFGLVGADHARRRLQRSRTLLGWGAIGEAAAHVGGWVLAVASLAAWKLGWLAPGNLAGFLGLSLLAYRPVREAGRLLPLLQRADRIWDRLQVQLSRAPAPAPSGNGLVVEELEAGWSPAQPVVRGVHLRLEPGDIAVAEGSNGCGKSTFLAALAGHCPHRALVARIPSRRWMAQEPVLPPLAPRDWIATPHPRALAILFPDGLPANLAWDQPIPHGGHDLSRGQRARLALLHIASSSANLWLLDEPLSALPADQRQVILRGLLELRGPAAVLVAEPVMPRGLEVAEVLWEPTPGSPGPRITRVRPA